jgi:hypothetical protein
MLDTTPFLVKPGKRLSLSDHDPDSKIGLTAKNSKERRPFPT